PPVCDHLPPAAAIGSDDPTLDAEVINLTAEFLRSTGASPFTLKINSVGTVESRAVYVVALKESIAPCVDQLCGSCQARFEKNPLRMLDCKNPQCKDITKDVPAIADYLDEESAAHFRLVTESLDAIGLKYVIDPRLVRGFDYYTKTAFEFTVDALGAQDAVCGGGRYDDLVQEIGGPKTPAVGMAMGVERLLRVLEARDADMGEAPHPTVFLVRMGEAAQTVGLALASKLRAIGVPTDLDYGNRGMKAQMKRAGKSQARLALILGDDEIAAGQVTARDLLAQQQWRLPLQGCAEMIKDYLSTSESAEIEAA
ncbi:MAG: histidine--tRNA ligase, partial [Armatimonadota bacterium]